MPTTPGLRRQAEREYYYRQLGGNFPQKTVDQLAREYYTTYLVGKAVNITHGTPLVQLELMWLKQYIKDKGATAPAGAGFHPVGFESSLWRQALVASGYAGQISKNMNDNRLSFYLNN
jgi:hypothetical protein